MKQLVIMNTQSGQLGIGIRVNFFDRNDDPLFSSKDYKISWSSSEPDGWCISDGGNYFIFLPNDIVRDRIEILSEL